MNDQDDTLTRLRLANPIDAIDTEELAALRATIDALATPSSPKRWPGLRWQSRPALVATAAVIVTLVLFVPLRYIGQRNGDVATPTTTQSVSGPSISSPSSVAATALPPPLSVDPTEMEWRRVEMSGLSGEYLWFDSVIAGGPGLIAVGSPNGNPAEFIWTSTDGADWTPARIDTPGDGWAFDVTATGSGFVAVGSSVWTSTSGATWETIDGRILGELRAITVGGPGLVAVGTIGDVAATVWTSVDGAEWTRVIPSEGVFGYTNTEMYDVVAGGPGLVAVGHFGGIGSVWTSADGLEWERVPHDPDVFGNGSEGTELFGVAAKDSGLVAVGRVTDDNTMGVWRSTDGISWSIVPLDPAVLNEGDELATVISTEQGFIAAGETMGDAAAWFSPDGLVWTRLNTGDTFRGPGYQKITDITTLGDSLVAVGWEIDGEYDSEAVWIAQPPKE